MNLVSAWKGGQEREEPELPGDPHTSKHTEPGSPWEWASLAGRDPSGGDGLQTRGRGQGTRHWKRTGWADVPRGGTMRLCLEHYRLARSGHRHPAAPADLVRPPPVLTTSKLTLAVCLSPHHREPAAVSC